MLITKKIVLLENMLNYCQFGSEMWSQKLSIKAKIRSFNTVFYPLEIDLDDTYLENYKLISGQMKSVLIDIVDFIPLLLNEGLFVFGMITKMFEDTDLKKVLDFSGLTGHIQKWNGKESVIVKLDHLNTYNKDQMDKFTGSSTMPLAIDIFVSKYDLFTPENSERIPSGIFNIIHDFEGYSFMFTEEIRDTMQKIDHDIANSFQSSD